jgi:hypothetical protein
VDGLGPSSPTVFSSHLLYSGRKNVIGGRRKNFNGEAAGRRSWQGAGGKVHFSFLGSPLNLNPNLNLNLNPLLRLEIKIRIKIKKSENLSQEYEMRPWRK